MSIAAVCEKCGRRYHSDAIAIGPMARQVAWRNTAVGSCACGGDIVLVDGGVDSQGQMFYLRRAVTALLGPELTEDDLRWLLEVVEVANRTGQTANGLAGQIEAERPVLAGILDILRDKAAGPVVGILGIVVAVILEVYPRRASLDVEDVVRQVIEQTAPGPDSPKVAQASAMDIKRRQSASGSPDLEKEQKKAGGKGNKQIRERHIRKKSWRNAQCQCGSGKRYSECHGKH